MPNTVTRNQLVEEIRARHAALAQSRAVLTGISGIDGSGKGWVARRLALDLEESGLRIAVLGADLWLNLPPVRFSPEHPGEHFYRHALRLEELLSQAVLPLRDHRRLDLEFDAVEETATTFRPERWTFADVDVIVLEGIFLFKRGLRSHFDLALWLDCSWETALERALARGQEGLPPEQTVGAYRTIYFPAQRVHLERDEPRTSADLVLSNDPRVVQPA
jgi:uridine kinase